MIFEFSQLAPLPPSPRIMSPMGFAVHRQARIRQYDEESAFGDDNTDQTSDIPTQIRPVPIWLCVFLVIGYIIAGAFLFAHWEGWTFLDSAYFCFITLTTIGLYTLTIFTVEKQKSIILCRFIKLQVSVILFQLKTFLKIKKIQLFIARCISYLALLYWP